MRRTGPKRSGRNPARANAETSRRSQIEGERVGLAFALLQGISDDDRPAEAASADFFREHRRIDSKLRGRVLSLVDSVMASRSRLDWLLSKADAPRPIGERLRLLCHLAAIERMAPERLRDAMSTSAFVTPLSAAEANLIRKLAELRIDPSVEPDWVRGAFPPWLKPDLRLAFGEDYVVEMAALAEAAPLDLRVNTLKTDRDTVLDELRQAGLEVSRSAFSPLGLRLGRRVDLGALAALREGRVEPQDEGSQLAALLVDAQPGQFVVDYCAGAGGKTLALAAQMANRGRLVAMDVSATRLERARLRLRRAGAHVADVRHTTEDRRWLKRQAGRADRVLVDAPCSGIGSWRRIPDARWRLRPDDLLELEEKQAEILAAAARLVRPGGRLIYVTCSILPRENERQVERFLSVHADFRLLPYGEVWRDVIAAASPTSSPCLLLTPRRFGTGGFFVAILERSAAPGASAEQKPAKKQADAPKRRQRRKAAVASQADGIKATGEKQNAE